MKITTSQILELTEKLIDSIGEITGRGFTESEEAALAVDVMKWLKWNYVEVIEE